jgi:hypothetical protein
LTSTLPNMGNETLNLLLTNYLISFSLPLSC